MSAARPPRPRVPRRTTTRLAFGVIVVFVVAQAVWWVVFQRGYISEVSDQRVQAWRADAVAAQAAWEASGRDAAVLDGLLSLHPHLRVRSGEVVVDDEVRSAFLAEQRGYLRMFAWEGGFFVAVILSMLGLIAASLREERELKRSHQNFLSAVTHEFKTPLATLRLLVETAQLRDLDGDRRRDYLARMAGEVDRLERTSEQVLAAARLEQGPLPARLEPRDLQSAVAGLLASLRPGLEARGAHVRLEGGEAPLPVSLDDDAFALVLGNLLDNAVKYAPEGRRDVVVRLRARGDLVEMHVDDHGVGIEESERERVFGRFHRSGDESTRRAPGTGLGLHLVRRTVEAMNGWVRADANPDGVGARLTVTLPRRVAADAPTAAGTTGPAAGEGAS